MATPRLISLFVSFVRLGAVAFGGPAMVAHIRRLAVVRKGWLAAGAFDDGVALCQMIPGATAMQTAAYVGFRARGVRGAAATFVGFGFPAFVLMLAFAASYARLSDVPRVAAVFDGLRALVVAVVAAAAISMGRFFLKDWPAFVVAAIAATLFGLRFNPILVILFAAALGLGLYRKLGVATTPRPTAAARSLWPLGVLAALVAAAFAIPLFAPKGLAALAALMVRVDVFAFGGGFASLPLMFHEVVAVRRWLDAATLLNGVALGQVTPGPIVITATFVGYMMGGPLAAVVATVAIFTPSFLMVVGTVPFYDRLRGSRYFTRAVRGVQCSFVGLLLAVTARFAWEMPWEPRRAFIAAGSFVALLLNVKLPYVVLAAVVVSALVLRNGG